LDKLLERLEERSRGGRGGEEATRVGGVRGEMGLQVEYLSGLMTLRDGEAKGEELIQSKAVPANPQNARRGRPGRLIRRKGRKKVSREGGGKPRGIRSQGGLFLKNVRFK